MVTFPGQVNLVAPADGEILYDVNGGLSLLSSVDLDWSLLPDATSYKLFISNSSGVYIFDSLIDSEIIGNQFTSNMFSSGVHISGGYKHITSQYPVLRHLGGLLVLVIQFNKIIKTELTHTHSVIQVKY